MARIKQIAVFKKPEGWETGQWNVYDVGTVAESIGINAITGLQADNVQTALEQLNTNLNGKISSLTTTVSNKVDKLGDTMTGVLNINVNKSNFETLNLNNSGGEARLAIKSNNFSSLYFKNNVVPTTSNKPYSSSANKPLASIIMLDNTDKRTAQIESIQTTTNNLYLSFAARRNSVVTPSSAYANGIYFHIGPDAENDRKITWTNPEYPRRSMGIVFENLSTAVNSTAQEAIKFAIGGNGNPYIRWTREGTYEKHQLVLSSASKTISYQKSNNKPNGDTNLVWSNLFSICPCEHIDQVAVSSSNDVTTLNVANNTYTRFPQKLIIPKAGTYIITAEGHFATNDSGRRKIVISTVNTATSASMLASNIFQKIWVPVSGDKTLDRITSVETFSSKLTYPLNLYLYLYQNSNTTLSGCTGLLKAVLLQQ